MMYFSREEAAATSEEIVRAFHELRDQEPGLLSGFVAAFEERKAIAGVPETKGIPNGLSAVLAGMLSSVVNLEGPSEDWHPPRYPDSFIQHFESTMRSFPPADRISLYLFHKHMSRNNCTATQLLRALFRDYIHRRRVYPY